MRCIAVLAVAIGLVIPFLAVAPAQAQATRTWVSGVGDDANPCSRTAPCKTFAGAISKTATGGEINVLDPGGFGAVTITKSITISSEGFEAGVLVSGTDEIVVSTPNATDFVQLIGLDIEGLGTGLDGVQIIGNGATLIKGCSIRHFTGNGITLAGGSGARVVVLDTVVTNNAGGMNVAGSGGVSNTGLSFRSTYDRNTNFAFQVAAGSTIQISDNRMFGVATPIIGAGTVLSFGDNLSNQPYNVTTTIQKK